MILASNGAHLKTDSAPQMVTVNENNPVSLSYGVRRRLFREANHYQNPGLLLSRLSQERVSPFLNQFQKVTHYQIDSR